MSTIKISQLEVTELNNLNDKETNEVVGGFNYGGLNLNLISASNAAYNSNYIGLGGVGIKRSGVNVGVGQKIYNYQANNIGVFN